jgi:S-adenosylmethionine/arginine decarboxylase-like enzyme
MKRYHLRLDLRDINFPKDKEKQREYILAWRTAILNTIGMRPLGEPDIKYGDNSPDGGQEGWTMTQIVDFSNFALHHFEGDREVKIDIFSCKLFDPKTAEAVCYQYFGVNVAFKDFVIV